MKRLGRCFLLWRCIFFSLQSYPLTIFLRNVVKTPVAAFLCMVVLLCILTMITHTKKKASPCLSRQEDAAFFL